MPPMLLGKGCICRTRWEKFLSQDHREPQFHITLSRAIGCRLRRTYAYVLTIQALAYLGKIIIHPTPVTSFANSYSARLLARYPGKRSWLPGLSSLASGSFLRSLPIIRIRKSNCHRRRSLQSRPRSMAPARRESLSGLQHGFE